MAIKLTQEQIDEAYEAYYNPMILVGTEWHPLPKGAPLRPSYAKLAKKYHVSEATLVRHLIHKKLVLEGLI